MKAIEFVILQIFFATRAVLKLGEYHSYKYSAVFNSWGIFGHVTCLNQIFILKILLAYLLAYLTDASQKKEKTM